MLGVFAIGLGLAGNLGTASAKPSGQVPDVDSLLDKEFRSIRTKGVPRAGPLGFHVRFFEHARNTEAEAVPTLVFTAGCNANGSRFQIRHGRLFATGEFVGTLIGCQVNPDPRIAKLLKKGMKIRQVGNRIVLASRGGRVKIVLVPDIKLRPATMESLDGKSFRSILIRSPRKLKRNIMRLSFTTGPLPRHEKDGKQVDGPLMLGSVGCNSMGGEYRVRDGRLRWIGDVYSTLMMCRPFHDRWLDRLLTKGVQARIAGPILTLTRGKVRVVLRRAAN